MVVDVLHAFSVFSEDRCCKSVLVKQATISVSYTHLDVYKRQLEAMSKCLVERGVTSFCPTSMTLPFEELERIFANVAEQKEMCIRDRSIAYSGVPSGGVKM